MLKRLLHYTPQLTTKLVSLIVIIGFYLFLFTPSAFAFNCISAQTGNFNAAATWTSCNSTTPQTTDTITINNGHTVTLVATTTVAGITVNSGGILGANTRAVADSGTFVDNGSVTGTTATLALSGSATTIDGTGTYAPTGLITITNNKTINSTANITFPGAITISTGTITNSGTITVSGTLTVTGTMTNNGTVTTNGTLTGAGSWTQGTNSTLNAGGGTTNAMAVTTVNFSTNVNTVNYKASGTQTCSVTQYYNLQFTGTSAKTCAITTNVLGSVTVGGTATWTLTTAITINGNLTVSGGTLTTGAVAFTVTGTTSISSGTLSLTNSTGTKLLTGAVSLSGGTLNGASTAIQIANGIANNGGTVTITGTATFVTNNQALDGAISITILTISNGITVTNNNTGTLTTPGVFTVTGSFINNGTVNASSTLTGAGSWTQGTNSTLNASGGTTNAVAVTTVDFSTNANTVNYAANATQTCKVVQYYNLQFTGTSAKTCAITANVLGNVTVGGTATWTLTTAITINGTVTISGGTLTTGAVAFTVTGATSISSGTLSLTSNTGTKLLTGLVTLTGGTLSGASTAIQFTNGITNNGGTVNITGTVTLATAGITFNGSSTIAITTLVVNSPGTVTNNGIVSIAGTFNGSGSWTQGSGSSLNVGGGTTNAIAITTFDASTNANTVTFNSTTAAQTVNGITYSSLAINKLGQVATLGGNITVKGNLSIINGTLNTSAANHYAIDVKGNWSNADTFTPNTSTVTFDGSGNQTINNPNTWYGLTITGGDRTVSFQSAAAQTIAANGSLTLTGTSGHLLTLAPLTAGTAWQLTVNNTGVTQSISNVSVSYSDASGGKYINASNGTNTDQGNNTNWLIIISISLDNTGSINLGALGLGSTMDTTATGTNDGRVITVNNGPAALNIKSTNFTNGGDTWALGSSNGVNTVKWEFSKDGSAWTTFTSPDPSSYTFDANAAQNATENLFFRMTMPTTASLVSNHTATVTIMASAP